LRPHKSPVPPDSGKELSYSRINPCPKLFIIRFKNNPLCPVFNGFFNVDKQAPDVYVFPERIAGYSPSSPDPYPSARERNNTINPFRVQDFLLSFCNYPCTTAIHLIQVQSSVNFFISRRFMNTS